MKKLHIIGSGGLAKEVISYIESEKFVRYEIKGCWGVKNFNNIEYQKYFRGSLDEFKSHYKNDELVIIAIAQNEIRKKIVEHELKSLDVNFTSYIHPSCEISNYASIGKGCIFSPGCIVCADASIDDFNFFNTHCAVGHDVRIGSYNCFFPKVEICGNCEISSNCIFGINSIILPEVKMQSNSKLDAGSVLRKSTESEGLYFGNPARLIKKS